MLLWNWYRDVFTTGHSMRVGSQNFKELLLRNSGREQLEAELHRMDVLLHREILRLHANQVPCESDLRGLYVSDTQVDW